MSTWLSTCAACEEMAHGRGRPGKNELDVALAMRIAWVYVERSWAVGSAMRFGRSSQAFRILASGRCWIPRDMVERRRFFKSRRIGNAATQCAVERCLYRLTAEQIAVTWIP